FGGGRALLARHAGAQLNLSGTLSRMRRIPEALAACRTALDLDPRNAMGHANFANLLRDAGNPEQAVEHYRAALALDPGSADAHNNLGLLYRELGQVEAPARALGPPGKARSAHT